MNPKILLTSQLLRELEAEVGTNMVAGFVFDALIDAIESYRTKDFGGFCVDFENLYETFSNTEPKFGIINHNFARLLEELKELLDKDEIQQEGWKKIVIQKIKALIKDSKKELKMLVKYSEELDVENKTILIHDHSHTVQDVLCHYKKMGKHFRVVIAEQDFDKTHDNIERMHGAKIPFQVIPAYMLSHVHDRIDMAFFGALTLKDTIDFVMDPGTHGIISEFHVIGVPIYMFINTDKFSLWKSRPRGEIFVHEHKRKHINKPIEYDRIKYSHDRVPANLFSKIVTNEGVFDAEGIERLFNEKYREYQKMAK